MRPSNIYNESIRQEIKNMIAESGGGGGSTGREVPAVTSSDDGKVLKATYSEGSGSYAWETDTAELPSRTSSNRGQFLGVNKSNDNLGWKDINQVPDPTYTTEGCVLMTNENQGTMDYVWGTINQVPSTSSATSGQVLTVNEDPMTGTKSAEWSNPSGGLPAYTSADSGKSLFVSQTGPTTTELVWQTKNYVPSTNGVNFGKQLKVGSSGNASWEWDDTIVSSYSIETTESTNSVLYTVTLPTLTPKAIFYGSDNQIFYEDVIIPINTQIGIDNKTIIVNFANLPSSMKIEPIEVILNGYETSNYTMESKIDNVSVDMGNFVITTKLKTNEMYGSDIRFLVIKNINETQTV